jgi:hypothetical protein
MSTVPPEELHERNLLSTRYLNAQKKAAIDDQVRGIRQAINFLIAKEEVLKREAEKLKPARSKA